MRIIYSILILICLVGGTEAVITSETVAGKYNVSVYDFSSNGTTPLSYNTDITLDSTGLYMVMSKTTVGNTNYEYPSYTNSYSINSDNVLVLNAGGTSVYCNSLTVNYLFCYVYNIPISLAFSKINNYNLTISKTGNGSGTVISSPFGIDCGDTCMVTVGLAETYKLLASPNTGSIFGGWSGCDSKDGNLCTVITKQDKNITAIFSKQTFYVTTTVSGNTSGIIKSDNSSINCGTDAWGLDSSCIGTYNYSDIVTLTATPITGKAFAGWGYGQCTSSTTYTCTFTVSANKTVFASFY